MPCSRAIQRFRLSQARSCRSRKRPRRYFATASSVRWCTSPRRPACAYSLATPRLLGSQTRRLSQRARRLPPSPDRASRLRVIEFGLRRQHRSCRIPCHDNVDHPISLYAATKKANELMAHAYSHLLRAAHDGLALFHGLRPVGPTRHGDVHLCQGDLPRASRSGCSTTAACGAISPMSTTSSRRSSASSIERRRRATRPVRARLGSGDQPRPVANLQHRQQHHGRDLPRRRA